MFKLGGFEFSALDVSVIGLVVLFIIAVGINRIWSKPKPKKPATSGDKPKSFVATALSILPTTVRPRTVVYQVRRHVRKKAIYLGGHKAEVTKANQQFVALAIPEGVESAVAVEDARKFFIAASIKPARFEIKNGGNVLSLNFSAGRLSQKLVAQIT